MEAMPPFYSHYTPNLRGGQGVAKQITARETKMMHRLRRYDVFRFAQNDIAPIGRNDAMFAIKCGEATHH